MVGRVISHQQHEQPEDVANRVASALDADILLYNGPILRPAEYALIDLCRARNRRRNVVLQLVTDGGDPDAAYRIARYVQDVYEKFTLFVSGRCKSSGTLIALGANELVISDYGELGPLDVQVRKPDELGETSSGLTINAAMSALEQRAFGMFLQISGEIKQRSMGQVSFKTAAEIATTLATGVFAPVYSQIDPNDVGEKARAMKIATDYALRLMPKSKNFQRETLEMLAETYSSHSFVIDRHEAAFLFMNVRAPARDEQRLADLIGELSRWQVKKWNEKPLIKYLSTDSETLAEADVERKEARRHDHDEGKRRTRRAAGDSGGTTREAPADATEHRQDTDAPGSPPVSGDKG